MKLSLEWLGDYLTFTEKNPEAIAAALTAQVAEIDDVEMQGALLKHCCVGKVVSLEKHPNADKLRVADVETDRGIKHVVCGGTNLRNGMTIAFAHVGAQVRHGKDLVLLKAAKIRDVTSEGMICAAEELELQDHFPPTKEEGDRPIIDFERFDLKLKVGTPLHEALGMNDVIFHVDNHAITHRADLFSHIGFARECVAIGLATWKKKPEFKAPRFGKDPVPFKLTIEEKRLMPRYCGCVLSIDGLGQTPDWMIRRLRATGWRPVNLPVDITNYVAMEVGVPLHSFDIDDIKGNVQMRTAKKGERIVTLDEKERELPVGALVLSDDKGIFDLLGIMGGLRSSTKESTRHIYLHSASLDPVSIRSTVIATGHRTDAATVYEKGVPFITAEQGFFRAAQLFIELLPGGRITSRMEDVGDNGTAKPIPFSTAEASRALGTEISEKVIETIFKDLGATVKKGKKKGEMTVTPPLWRLKDLRGPHDLVEEVGRVYGYDRIDATVPEAPIAPPARDPRIHHLRDALKTRSYTELLPLSLVGPELLRRCNMDTAQCLKVANAIGEEYSLLQPSLLPRLLDHAERNMLLVQDALQTFTAGRIFGANGKETWMLGALFASRNETNTTTDPFFCLKRDVTEALDTVGYDATIRPPDSVPAFAHPGRTAVLALNSKAVGSLFEIHPSVRKQFDLPHRAAALFLDLDVLFAITPKQRISQALPQYPAITYDVTVTLDRNRAFSGLLQKIQKSSALLESVEVADIYSGKPLGADQYNLTFRCTYRSPERTLTEEEVKKEHGKIEAAIR